MENNFIIIIRSQKDCEQDVQRYDTVLSSQYCCTIISSWVHTDQREVMFRLKATEHCIIELLKVLSRKFPSEGIELFEFVDC